VDGAPQIHLTPKLRDAARAFTEEINGTWFFRFFIVQPEYNDVLDRLIAQLQLERHDREDSCVRGGATGIKLLYHFSKWLSILPRQYTSHYRHIFMGQDLKESMPPVHNRLSLPRVTATLEAGADNIGEKKYYGWFPLWGNHLWTVVRPRGMDTANRLFLSQLASVVDRSTVPQTFVLAGFDKSYLDVAVQTILTARCRHNVEVWTWGDYSYDRTRKTSRLQVHRLDVMKLGFSSTSDSARPTDISQQEVLVGLDDEDEQ